MSQTASATPAVDPQNPWPGLLSFPEEAERFFNGRDTESSDLLRLIRRDTLTLLYGQSGLGKSSLLLAGLFPLLRRERMLPVHVRLDHDEISPPHDQRVRNLVLAACAEHRITPPDSPPTDGTWELLHHADGFWDAKNYPVTPVIVIDQFEEIFTLGAENQRRQDRSNRFMEQLGDLIDNNPPDALLERLAIDPGEAAAFVFAQPSYKIVLSLREDYLADLRRLREHTRSTMQNEMRLLRMRGDQALLAVETTGGALVEPGAARVIVRGVARASGAGDDLGLQETADAADAAADDELTKLAELEVEPALLSMVCSELNERRKSAGLSTITADLLKRTRNEILADFYERSFAGLHSGARVFVEERLLNDSGRHRNFAALDDAVGYAPKGYDPVTAGDIKALVEGRLLRVEERLKTRRVEITHDVLTEVVRISRDRRRAQEKRRAEQAATAARRRRQVVAVAVLLLLAVATAAWAHTTREQAKRNEKAEIQIRAAEKRIEDAERRIRDKDQELARQQADLKARDILVARQDSTLLQRQAALRDSTAELDRQRLALGVQTTQTREARDAAERSERASQVGAEAAQHYRSVTGLLLERRTATTANLERLTASLKDQEVILARVDSVRAVARALETAYCQATESNTSRREQDGKNLRGVDGRPLCAPAPRQAGTEPPARQP